MYLDILAYLIWYSLIFYMFIPYMLHLEGVTYLKAVKSSCAIQVFVIAFYLISFVGAWSLHRIF